MECTCGYMDGGKWVQDCRGQGCDPECPQCNDPAPDCDCLGTCYGHSACPGCGQRISVTHYAHDPVPAIECGGEGNGSCVWCWALCVSPEMRARIVEAQGQALAESASADVCVSCGDNYVIAEGHKCPACQMCGATGTEQCPTVNGHGDAGSLCADCYAAGWAYDYATSKYTKA